MNLKRQGVIMDRVNFPYDSRIPGLIKKDDGFIFNFFNKQVHYSKNGTIECQGPALTKKIQSALSQYFSDFPRGPWQPSCKLITLREFTGSGPLYSRFTANTCKTIEATFSGNLHDLKKQCLALGARIKETPSHDLSARFQALSTIPIILNFNDKDDIMPANAVFLFYDDADKYLDLKGLGVLITYLTGLLIT